ncbi:hypothetical protein [Leptodesmis sp.]|uniref:hypothetical protein n=1 Tax=Leptodesmis sp. TaxID=3100501 RepID=UPI0040535384
MRGLPGETSSLARCVARLLARLTGTDGSGGRNAYRAPPLEDLDRAGGCVHRAYGVRATEVHRGRIARGENRDQAQFYIP